MKKQRDFKRKTLKIFKETQNQLKQTKIELEQVQNINADSNKTLNNLFPVIKYEIKRDVDPLNDLVRFCFLFLGEKYRYAIRIPAGNIRILRDSFECVRREFAKTLCEKISFQKYNLCEIFEDKLREEVNYGVLKYYENRNKTEIHCLRP